MTANLLDFDIEGLAAFCETLGEKRFRATQLYRWIHQRGVKDFSAMSDLAKSLREKLPQVAHISAPAVLSRQNARDGDIIMVTNKNMRYRIHQVPFNVYRNWRRSPSKGKYWHKFVKNNFEIERIL